MLAMTSNSIVFQVSFRNFQNTTHNFASHQNKINRPVISRVLYLSLHKKLKQHLPVSGHLGSLQISNTAEKYLRCLTITLASSLSTLVAHKILDTKRVLMSSIYWPITYYLPTIIFQPLVSISLPCNSVSCWAVFCLVVVCFFLIPQLL